MDLVLYWEPVRTLKDGFNALSGAGKGRIGYSARIKLIEKVNTGRSNILTNSYFLAIRVPYRPRRATLTTSSEASR